MVPNSIKGLSHPQLATWAETNFPEGFAVFGPPDAHRVRMRTTNGLERLNKELKRRTQVATLFPNPDSCLRLVSALRAEQDEEWLLKALVSNWPGNSKTKLVWGVGFHVELSAMD